MLHNVIATRQIMKPIIQRSRSMILSNTIKILTLTSVLIINSTSAIPRTVSFKEGPIGRSCNVCPDFTCASYTGQTGETGTTGVTCPTCTQCTGYCPSPLSECVKVETAFVDQSLVVNCQTINNALVVNKSVDIKGNLTTEEEATLSSIVCMGNDLDVATDLSIEANAVILGQLVTNQAAIEGGLEEIGLLNIQGNTIVNKDQTITGSATIQGAAAIGGNLLIDNGVSVSHGETINNGGLIVSEGNVSITSNACINGNQSVSGDVTANTIVVDGVSTFNTLTSGSNTDFTANKSTTLNSNLTITNGDQLNIAGTLSLTQGDLLVQGTTLLENVTTIENGALISKGLTVSNGQTIQQGNLEVTQGNFTIGGTLRVNGAINSTGPASFGNLTVTSPQQSTSIFSGSLITNGGVGIENDLWVGNAEYLPTNQGVAAGLDYYEETVYATIFTWGGITVSPGLSIPIRLVRIGDLVNVMIPAFVINNPGNHVDVISSTNPIPSRFAPAQTVRGPSSTIVYYGASGAQGSLGEFNISPQGTITLGLPSTTFGPSTVTSSGAVQIDYNSFTYRVGGNNCSCN